MNVSFGFTPDKAGFVHPQNLVMREKEDGTGTDKKHIFTFLFCIFETFFISFYQWTIKVGLSQEIYSCRPNEMMCTAKISKGLFASIAFLVSACIILVLHIFIRSRHFEVGEATLIIKLPKILLHFHEHTSSHLPPHSHCTKPSFSDCSHGIFLEHC